MRAGAGEAASDIPVPLRRRTAPAVTRSARAFMLASFAVAMAAFVAAPLLAIPWSRQPFPGFLVEQTLVVQPVINAEWSGVQAGIAYPQRIMRAAAQPLSSARDLDAIMAVHGIGSKLLVFARFPNGSQQIFPVIQLAEFPSGDLWRLFWLPYLVGAVYLAIGGWIYRLRGHTRSGATLALFCTVTALTCGLLFDTLTTHALTVVWSVAVALIGGTLIELALRFPEEWGAVTRRPWLSFVPFLISLGLAAWAVLAYLAPADPWTYLVPRIAGFRYAGIGIVVFQLVMFYRTLPGSSPLVRRQARLVTVGSTIAFTPAMIWLALPLLRTYGDQVRAFVEMSEPTLITRRLLEDAVRTLRAQSGAVFLITAGELQRAHTVGDWKNNPRLSVTLQCGSHRHGVLLLGPPQEGHSYDRQEVEVLQQVAHTVAKAVCVTKGGGRMLE